MRCHYLSDLHLESQDFSRRLAPADVLIIAGDLAHARCLDQSRSTPYHLAMRDRVMRFADAALETHRHVLLVPGNHDHYDGVFEETAALLRTALPGITVLDDHHVDIDGIRFFGSTLWTNFNGGDTVAMDAVRRRLGEYFFVKTRRTSHDGSSTPVKFRPEDALGAFSRGWSALQRAVSSASGNPLVIVSHHAPSLRGLNPRHSGNGLDCAYASDLDAEVARITEIRFWIHGHTHIRRSYRVAHITVLANCRGFEGRDPSASGFDPNAFFEL